MEKPETHSELVKRTRPVFADVYIRLSLDLARRADCKRAQVGCVITDEHGTQVYGIGYNGGAAHDFCRCTGEQGKCGCIHAEANALIKCRTQDTRKIVYATSSPCKTCAKLIVNSGCIAVYWVRKHRDFEESEQILRRARIESIEHKPSSRAPEHPFHAQEMFDYMRGLKPNPKDGT